MVPSSLGSLTDADVIAGIHRQVHAGQRALVMLLRLLAEAEQRDLPQARGHAPLFAMCRALGFSEGESNWRVRAARLARRLPRVLEMLEDSSLSLTTAVALAPVLRADNAERLLRAAAGRSRAEVDVLVAAEGGKRFLGFVAVIPWLARLPGYASTSRLPVAPQAWLPAGWAAGLAGRGSHPAGARRAPRSRRAHAPERPRRRRHTT